MALQRRTGQRFQSAIWPGFVDAMTGLLLVLMFVLTIFMVVQFVLRETITGQESELDALSAEVSALAQALGLEERRADGLAERVGALSATLEGAQINLAEQSALIAALQADRAAQDTALSEAEGQITRFEAQVAALLADQDRAQAAIADLEGERAALLTEQEALNLALAQSRSEIDAQAEAARLDAARREALEALIADLETRGADAADRIATLEAGDAEAQARITDLQAQLSEEEAARLVEAAAAEALRSRLQDADAELTAMTLALEQQRRRAEETLTLLAAAQAARDDLDARLLAALSDVDEAALALAEQEDIQARLQTALSDQEDLRARLLAALAAQQTAEAEAAERLSLAEQRAALLAAANVALSEEQALSAEGQREAALLNQQVAALRTQLGVLQTLLDEAQARDAAAQVQLESLGSELNTALAQVAAEERRRRQLEEAERIRLEQEAADLAAQAQDLERYRSEFFGRLREVLSGQDRVRIVGDRFIFSSEVLFAPARADLSAEGRTEIDNIADILNEIAADIPPDIDWVIRVDGHTDDTPLTGFGAFADNWELSQARALSVVRYMVDELGFPPQRLAANGFAEFQPLNPADTALARAQNRRIELKLTER
ncbi:peptidoglycan -binding protein [Aestuariivita sp.]|jgi:chemotaxis protein MotB|uniref:peptidoglycan -binding protein n=1 Tax=Aestuariivita sp. TaxID=1872407 RepID=UPI002171E5C4|nr:peptidoglycan -binding protein [Aestuariivita sp.]MCE8008489.1 peptidoglycan -binding protein [Aestuariivita sp.]